MFGHLLVCVQEELLLAQAPLLKLVCAAALKNGIKLVNAEVHSFLAAAVQVRRLAAGRTSEIVCLNGSQSTAPRHFQGSEAQQSLARGSHLVLTPGALSSPPPYQAHLGALLEGAARARLQRDDVGRCGPAPRAATLRFCQPHSSPCGSHQHGRTINRRVQHLLPCP
jgi:hypothetical protein